MVLHMRNIEYRGRGGERQRRGSERAIGGERVGGVGEAEGTVLGRGGGRRREGESRGRQRGGMASV